MKRWTIALLVLVAAVLVLALTGRKSVHAELLVPADAGPIWAVLTDTSGYGEWNPIFVAVAGEFSEGGTLTYQMKSPDGRISEVEPTVRTLTAEREINQYGGLRGIMTFDHTWRLEPSDRGTLVTQHEEYTGIFVWFWNPTWVEAAYGEALVALRDRVAGS